MTPWNLDWGGKELVQSAWAFFYFDLVWVYVLLPSVQFSLPTQALLLHKGNTEETQLKMKSRIFKSLQLELSFLFSGWISLFQARYHFLLKSRQARLKSSKDKQPKCVSEVVLKKTISEPWICDALMKVLNQNVWRSSVVSAELTVKSEDVWTVMCNWRRACTGTSRETSWFSVHLGQETSTCWCFWSFSSFRLVARVLP